MRETFNNRDEFLKRQSLRAQMPVAERLGWKHLRGEALGVKFRRQVSIGRYVVDFYCPLLHLAIEVDGETHAGEDARAYDEVRLGRNRKFGRAVYSRGERRCVSVRPRRGCEYRVDCGGDEGGIGRGESGGVRRL